MKLMEHPVARLGYQNGYLHRDREIRVKNLREKRKAVSAQSADTSNSQRRPRTVTRATKTAIAATAVTATPPHSNVPPADTEAELCVTVVVWWTDGDAVVTVPGSDAVAERVKGEILEARLCDVVVLCCTFGLAAEVWPAADPDGV
jgi:hypothetical protein